MPKAVSYIRFSSGPQGKGSTTERQKELIRQWLDANPEIKRSSLSQEDLGRSGYKGAHLDHGLGRILQAIEDGEIRKGDYILVEAIDRIGRLEPFEMVDLIRKIVSKDVTIVTLEDSQTYSREALNKDMSALYILIGKIQQSHQYSKLLSQRISAAYERKRAMARRGESIRLSTPYWLDSEGKIIPDKGAAVKDCIKLFMKGHGTRRVILELRDTWPELAAVHPSTLKRWFKNSALLGVWANGSKPIHDVFEPLIDRETFYLLQGELERRRREMSPEQTYDLSGLVVCEECKKRFYYRRKKHRSSVIVYANCSTYLKRGKPYCSNNRTWPYEALRAILQFSITQVFLSLGFDKSATEAAQKVESLKQEKAHTIRQIEQYLDVLVQIPEQQNTVDRIRELEEKSREIDREIERIEEDFNRPVPSEEEAWEVLFDSINEAELIAEDPVELRDLLKRNGFRISLSGNDAKILSDQQAEFSFSLLRRSTKFHCYIMRAYSEIDVEDHGECEYYFAVDRKGVRVVTFDEQRLEEFLEERSKDSRYALEFSKGPVPANIVLLAEY